MSDSNLMKTVMCMEGFMGIGRPRLKYEHSCKEMAVMGEVDDTYGSG